MKLYLSSFKIGDEPEKLRALLPEKARVLYVSNALDFARAEIQKKHQDWDRQDLEKLGFMVEELDLRDYFHKKEALTVKLDKTDLLYVSGGNVYDLRLALALSGLDKLLQERHKDPATTLVYAAYSAGVCVLSPTLKGYHIVDNPALKTYGDYETLWDGLGLISWQFAPHFESAHEESSAVQKEIAYHIEHGLPYKGLRDGEVMVLT